MNVLNWIEDTAPFFISHRLQYKLAVLVSLPIVVIAAVVFFYLPSKVEEEAINRIAVKSQVIGQMTSFNISPAVYFSDKRTILESFESVKQNEDLVFITVTDLRGNILATYNETGFAWRPLISADAQASQVSADGRTHMRRTLIEQDKHAIGYLVMGFSLDETQVAINTGRWLIVIASFCILILGIGGVLLASKFVTRQLHGMVDTVDKVAKGDLSQRAEIGSKDELGYLARAFNSMIRTLESAYHDMEVLNRSLEERVADRTQALQKEIEEHTRTEEVLLKNEEHTAALLTAMPDLIYRMSDEGIFLDIHIPKGFQTMPGMETFTGKNVLDVFPQEMAQSTLRCLQNALQSEGTQGFEFQDIIHGEVRDRETRILRCGPDEVLGIIRDITLQKQLDRELVSARQSAEEAARLKSEFLANMSHEIRTPMNAVIGMTSLLWESDLADEQREFVQTIRNSGENLLVLINDILDLSKIESDKLDLESSPLDLVAVVEDSMDLFGAKIADRSIDLIYEPDDDVPRAVFGDSTRLRQVFVNLIGNALKFTQAGLIHVRSNVVSRSGNESVIRFSVKDTGIGIPPERMDRLFKTFSQVDASTTRQYGGTGLGLAITKRLVEMMGGNIGVESVMGQGSTFFFTLRLTVVEETNSSEKTVEGILGHTILLISDQPVSGKVLAGLCSQWGARVRSAVSLESAQEDLRQHGIPDLVIVNLLFQDINFSNELQKLKAAVAKVQTKVLVVAALNSKMTQVPDMDGVIYRPFRRSHCVWLLRNALSGAAPVSAAAKRAENHMPLANEIPLRILVAEDNEVNQNLVVRMFGRLGYYPEVVSSGQEVLDAVADRTYDVIFLDVQMPGIDGYETARRLTAILPKERPRIIAMTANALKGDREKCIAAGMDDYLAKPVDLGQIRTLLQKYGPSQARST